MNDAIPISLKGGANLVIGLVDAPPAVMLALRSPRSERAEFAVLQIFSSEPCHGRGRCLNKAGEPEPASELVPRTGLEPVSHG